MIYKTYFQHYHIDWTSEARSFLLKAMREAFEIGQLEPYEPYFIYDDGARFNADNFPKVFNQCEGITVCTVEDRNRVVVSKGFAFFVPPSKNEKVLNPAQRQFNRPEGRRIALRKAKRDMGLQGILKGAKFVLRWSDVESTKVEPNQE